MNRKLLYRFFRSETTPQEDDRIIDWLEKSPDNRDLFEAERNIYNSLAIHSPGVIETSRRPAKKIYLRRVAGYAAGIAAAVLLAVGGHYWGKTSLYNDMTAQTMSVSVPLGQRLNITLCDGTSVWLNAGTTMDYPTLMGRERRVRVDGEALFDVEHDAERPFVVETFACDIEVLGTKFNVRADSRTGDFSTALLEGRLKVSDNSGTGKSIILSPNDIATLSGGSLHVSGIRNAERYRWPEGLISLVGISFEDLIAEFEKSYAVNIVIETTETPQINFKGKIRVSDGIDHALRILQRTADFSYVKDENSNTIYIR